jgi:hypothetical protein
MADNTVLPTGTGGDTIRTIARTANSPAKTQAVALDFGGASDSSAESIVSTSNPLPIAVYGPSGTNQGVLAAPLFMQSANSNRTYKTFWANTAASGTTTTETAITLTYANGIGGSTTTGTSFTPTSGKTFRITSITFGCRGNSTATAQITVFSLRVNTSGAVTTSSNINLSTVCATPSTANAWDRVTVSIPDGALEIAGNGTIQWGMTANATFTTNAPTWDVLITGYEF